MNTQTKETKHTPGPWTYIYNGTCLDLKGNCGNTLVAEFPTMAKEDGTAYRPSEEDAANLALIAAAPELLEACKALKDCLGSIHFPNGDPECVATSLELAQQAIAKAEGRGE